MPVSLPAPLPACLLLAVACAAGAQEADCRAESAATRTPVLELYTSEGCSSCPPADRWLSGLKDAAAAGRVVVQAFHVGYWDSLGWVDRFAAPAYTQRQRALAAGNRLSTIYTPQLVRDGRDWRDYAHALAVAPQAATVAIRLARSAQVVQARVTPLAAGTRWSAYWSVTEHGYSSKVNAGENSGELLQHDFVVRQYVPVGQYEGTQDLKLRPLPPTAGHAQQVNLVVTAASGSSPLQALSLQCH
jgi:hypothetical protein